MIVTFESLLEVAPSRDSLSRDGLLSENAERQMFETMRARRAGEEPEPDAAHMHTPPPVKEDGPQPADLGAHAAEVTTLFQTASLRMDPLAGSIALTPPNRARRQGLWRRTNESSTLPVGEARLAYAKLTRFLSLGLG
jgi:hypothetical protein